ncbi:MAG: Xaa-Pro peptidase family protein [Chloroflexota bacterium]
MTYGKFNVEYEQRIYNPERMRQYRLERAQAMLKKHGLGSMLIMDFDNQRYLSFETRRGWMRHRMGLEFVLLVKDAGFPYCSAPRLGRMPWEMMMPWFKDKGVLSGAFFQNSVTPDRNINIKQWDNGIAIIKDLLKKHGVASEPVGVDVCGMNMVEAFRKGGIELVSGVEALAEARMIKNQDEIECHRVAGSIAEAAHWEVARALRPGMTEMEVAGIAAKACYDHGAEDMEGPSFVVHSGPRAGQNNPRTATDRAIRPGDMVVVDINGVGFEGYRTCFYRTYCVGDKPTDFQKEIYKDAYDCQVAMEQAIKPGLTNAQIAETIMKAGEGRWYNGPTFPEPGKYWSCHFGGHEIGLTSGDCGPGWGAMDKAPNRVMEPGRVLAVEVGASEWDGQNWSYDGAKLENCGVVTEKGFEIFYRFPYAELITCGLPGVY